MNKMKIDRPAINIQHPWAKLILTREKVIETRRYPIPKKYVGMDILVIETPGKGESFPARIVGIVNFVNCFKYSSREEFDKDFAKHLVGKESNFYWCSGATHWGWVVASAKKFKGPIRAPTRKGIRWTSKVSIRIP